MGVQSNPLLTQLKGHYNQILIDLINQITPIYLNPLHVDYNIIRGYLGDSKVILAIYLSIERDASV
jgi:hypothetical protein